MQVKQIFTAYDRFRGKGGSGGYAGFNFCPVCAQPLSAGPLPDARHLCPDCGWTFYHNPAPGVVILITREERVLIGRRRAGSYLAGRWCLPGGFVEFEEDFLSAALRETLEETGLRVEIQSIISVCSNFLKPSLHTVVTVLKATVTGGEAAPGDDLDELRWVPLQGPFPEMAFEADIHIIERYRRTRLAGAPVEPIP